MRRAMDAIDRLQQRLAEVERAPGESIAVMGMGCRFPGQVNSPESFWQLLEAARHGICKTPDDRWNSDHYLDSNPNTAGKIITNQGGFLDRIQEFDPGFFGITPKEIPEPLTDGNVTDVNSSSAEAPLIPQVDLNASLPVVEQNASAPSDGNESE